MKNFKPILTAMSLCMALAAAAAPVRQHLHDDWQFRQARLNNWYPATVPGTVHTDLMANRIIEDPYFRLNERGVQWVDCGDDDFLWKCNVDFYTLMRERDIPLQYRMRDGGHTWRYWQTVLPDALTFVSNGFGK